MRALGFESCELVALFASFWIAYLKVCSDTGKSYTYSQLTDAVRRLAANLRKLGVREGDVLFLLSPNLPEYAVIYLATISIGAIVTTNNPMYTASK